MHPNGAAAGSPAMPRRWHGMKTDTGTGATSDSSRPFFFPELETAEVPGSRSTLTLPRVGA